MRSVSSYTNNLLGAYRYGFQGQERDDEIKGKGNSLNYKYRMHDARLGRFFAIDPLTAEYPQWSPYQFSGNQVISSRELEGLEPDIDLNNTSEQTIKTDGGTLKVSEAVSTGTISESGNPDRRSRVVEFVPDKITPKEPTKLTPSSENPIHPNGIEDERKYPFADQKLNRFSEIPSLMKGKKNRRFFKHPVTLDVNVGSEDVLCFDTESFKNVFKIKQDGKTIWNSRKATPTFENSRGQQFDDVAIKDIANLSNKARVDLTIKIRPKRSFKSLFKIDIFSIKIITGKFSNPRFL